MEESKKEAEQKAKEEAQKSSDTESKKMLKSSGVRAIPPGVVNTGYLLSPLLSGMSPGLGLKPYKFV